MMVLDQGGEAGIAFPVELIGVNHYALHRSGGFAPGSLAARRL
jgi:hypothetical protein